MICWLIFDLDMHTNVLTAVELRTQSWAMNAILMISTKLYLSYESINYTT
jgi:hypothetical protein